MTEVLHIWAGQYTYVETDTGIDVGGSAIPIPYDVTVECSWCGLEDYVNNLPFAYPEDTATCQNCIDEYALHLLKELDDE